jgi:hypothetical protein
VANQLRAHLQIVFPGVVGLFSDIDSAISLRFLERFPTPERAAWLTPRRLGAWLSSVGYCGRTPAETLHRRLIAAPAGLSGPAADTGAAITAAFVATLRALNTQIKTLAARIREDLATHPDQHIFTSLPRAGQIRAARLLAEIGDARGRFPTAESLACLAGVAPSTRQSGKVRAVSFRWGADKQLRDALCDFAGDSRTPTPGPPTSTPESEPAATTIRTPCASSPAPGRASSGPVGPPTPPTSQTDTPPCNTSSTEINQSWRVDTGQLTSRAIASSLFPAEP